MGSNEPPLENASGATVPEPRPEPPAQSIYGATESAPVRREPQVFPEYRPTPGFGDGGWGNDGSGPEGAAGLPVKFYWQQIRRHYRRILAAVALVTLLTWVHVSRLPKQYASTAQVRIDPGSSTQFLSNNQYSDDDSYNRLRTTLAGDVTSRSVVDGAIQLAHLDEHYHIAKVSATVGDANAEQNALYNLVVNSTQVSKPEGTRNIEITYVSTDPDLSAQMANALAKSLIQEDFKTRMKALANSTSWMQRRLDDLRAQMEQSTQALVRYERTNNIVNLNDRETLSEQKLQQLESELLNAQAARAAAEAQLNTVQNGELAALLASKHGASLQTLQDAVNVAQLRFSDVSARVGPANPVYQQAQAELLAAQKDLDKAKQQTVLQVAADYRRAVRREELDQKSVSAAKAQMDELSGKSIDYDVLKQNADSVKRIYNDMLQATTMEQLRSGFHGNMISISDAAVADRFPVAPHVGRSVELAFLLSLLCGCGVAVLVGVLDNTFSAPERVEQSVGVPLLGSLPIAEQREHVYELVQPHTDHSTALALQRSAFAEAALTLRTSLLFSSPERTQCISFTSAQPLEGKSSVAVNVAAALALHGSKVLVIDADIRRPTVHRILDAPNRVGLSSALRNAAPLEDCILPTPVDHLFVMPAGPAAPHPAELLATGMPEILELLKPEFDHIILDCPPLLGFADALTMATLVDGVVLVTRASKTPREQVRTVLRQLMRVRANVLGLVLNAVDTDRNQYYYYRDNPHADTAGSGK